MTLPPHKICPHCGQPAVLAMQVCQRCGAPYPVVPYMDQRPSSPTSRTPLLVLLACGVLAIVLLGAYFLQPPPAILSLASSNDPGATPPPARLGTAPQPSISVVIPQAPVHKPVYV